MLGRLQQRPVDLVIVGHLAFNEDRTPMGTQMSIGGAAYYCAVGASVASPERVGIVATAGPDFDIAAVATLGVNLDGVAVKAEGLTARFIITQLQDGSRTFEATWGLAEHVDLTTFPTSYSLTRHVHLATAPPGQQLVWIQWLRGLPSHPRISADTFEHFVRAFPDETRRVLALTDMVFVNEEEAVLLGIGDCRRLGKPCVLKRGARGTRYINRAVVIDAPAQPVEAVETTGAGDVLAGAFLSLRTRGRSPTQALQAAVETATASVTDFGTAHEDLSRTIQSVRVKWQDRYTNIHRGRTLTRGMEEA
jgi:sugar/nucleoside kinase (ribokinase family)